LNNGATCREWQTSMEKRSDIFTTGGIFKMGAIAMIGKMLVLFALS